MDSNHHSPGLLVGQSTLRERIKLGTFAALDQRIALRYATMKTKPAGNAGGALFTTENRSPR